METCTNCGAALSPDIDWCGQCYTHVPRVRAGDVVVVPDVAPTPSRGVAAGEKVLLTALLVAFGIVAYVALVPVVDVVGSTIWGTVVSFLGLYTVLGLVGLWLVWRPAPQGRPERPAEHAVVIAGTVVLVPDVAERH